MSFATRWAIQSANSLNGIPEATCISDHSSAPTCPNPDEYERSCDALGGRAQLFQESFSLFSRLVVGRPFCHPSAGHRGSADRAFPALLSLRYRVARVSEAPSPRKRAGSLNRNGKSRKAESEGFRADCRTDVSGVRDLLHEANVTKQRIRPVGGEPAAHWP
jgi:hypothetical protein